MSGKINSYAYTRLIDDNINWLIENSKESFIRDHIVAVMKASVKSEYPHTSYEKVKNEIEAMNNNKLNVRGK